MRAVAIRADRSFFGSGGYGVSVYARLVRGDHLRTLATVFHDEFLAVAGAARRRDIRVMNL